MPTRLFEFTEKDKTVLDSHSEDALLTKKNLPKFQAHFEALNDLSVGSLKQHYPLCRK